MANIFPLFRVNQTLQTAPLYLAARDVTTAAFEYFLTSCLTRLFKLQQHAKLSIFRNSYCHRVFLGPPPKE